MIEILSALALRKLRIALEPDDAMLAQSAGEVRAVEDLESDALVFRHLALPYPMAHPITRGEPRLTVVPVLPLRSRALHGFLEHTTSASAEEDPLYEWLFGRLDLYRQSEPGGLLEGVFQASGRTLDEDVDDHYTTLAARLGGVQAARDFIERFDAAVEQGTVSVAEPKTFEAGLHLLRGLGLNVISREESAPLTVEAELWFLPRRMTAEELLSFLDPLRAQRLQLSAGVNVVTATTYGLTIQARLLTGSELKKWIKREPTKSRDKETVVQIDYVEREDYRGEKWETSSGPSQVFYRAPIHVVALGKRFEQIADARFVNLRHWPRFR